MGPTGLTGLEKDQYEQTLADALHQEMTHKFQLLADKLHQLTERVSQLEPNPAPLAPPAPINPKMMAGTEVFEISNQFTIRGYRMDKKIHALTERVGQLEQMSRM